MRELNRPGFSHRGRSKLVAQFTAVEILSLYSKRSLGASQVDALAPRRYNGLAINPLSACIERIVCARRKEVGELGISATSKRS